MRRRLLILLTLAFTLFALAACNFGFKPTEKPDVSEEDDFDLELDQFESDDEEEVDGFYYEEDWDE